MVEEISALDLTPWTPQETCIPESWIKLVQRFLQRTRQLPVIFIMEDIEYDAQYVGNKLRSWGLPWPVVVAGYLWSCDREQIRYCGLDKDEVNEVLSHIAETNLYIRSIQEEDLARLLNPPYRDLGALLIAVVAYYRALQILQKRSNGQVYTGSRLSQIESVGRTLLNISKLLGMWQFKRKIEDLQEQLRSPHKYREAEQEHKLILARDNALLEDIRYLLSSFYRQTTGNPINIIVTPCGIAGMKRRQQDAHTTASSYKTQLSGFDLVTFEIIVSEVHECYEAMGILSQLGYIQDRVTDQLANPKPNGCSHIAFGLIVKPQDKYNQGLKWSETYTPVCQLQIATHVMHAITWYGCLYSAYYQLHTDPSAKEKPGPKSAAQFWTSREGKVFFAIKELLSKGQYQPEIHAPIVVYDKNRRPIKLPKGATALDFAYSKDSTLGEHAVEAFINNRKAPLNRVLEAGDIIEIRTAYENQVQDYWLHKDFTVTSSAQQQIKEALYQRYPAGHGYDLICQELEHYHYMLPREEIAYELRFLVEQYQLETVQSYLERVGKKKEAEHTAQWAAQKIMQHITERNESLPSHKGRITWVPILDMQIVSSKNLFQKQYLCSFCRPSYPRDMKIMGRLHKRSGKLVVHKETCPHLIDRSEGSNSILLPMMWKPEPTKFPVAFFVIAQDRRGLLLDLTKQLRRHQCDLLSMNAETVNKWGEARLRFTIETHADKEVMDIWQEVRKIDGIIKAEINAAETPPHIYERLQKLPRQKSLYTEKTVLATMLAASSPADQARPPALENPFDISRPATAKMFFGRSLETERMQRDLCEGRQGRALILHGPRRSGKSSICKNFLERYVQGQKPFWGVLFSLQNATNQNEETILMQLAEKISREFHEQLQQSAPGWHDYQDNDPQIRFRHVIQGCLNQVRDARLVLALDEFGGAFESHGKHILEHRFFTYWKELIQNIPQLSLIIALPPDAYQKLNERPFSHVFNFTESLPVSFLDVKSARQLIVQPLRNQHIAIHPNTVALAVKMTGGNPYYMTLIGHRLIRQLNREKEKQLITDEELKLVFNELIAEEAHQNFVFLKREIHNEEEFCILKSIVELTEHPKRSKIQLKKIADHTGLSISLLKQHLDRLRAGLILEENGPTSNPYYSFKIELVRHWLAHNAWFFTDFFQKQEDSDGK